MQTNTIGFSNSGGAQTSICTIDGTATTTSQAIAHPPSFATTYRPHTVLLVAWLVICVMWRKTGRVNTADWWLEEDGQVNSQDLRDLTN